MSQDSAHIPRTNLVRISQGDISCIVPSWYTPQMREEILENLSARRDAAKVMREEIERCVNEECAVKRRLKSIFFAQYRTREGFDVNTAEAQARLYDRMKEKGYDLSRAAAFF